MNYSGKLVDGRRLELPTSALRTAEDGETRDDELDAIGCDARRGGSESPRLVKPR